MYPVPKPDGSLRSPWPVYFSTLSGSLDKVFGEGGVYVLPLVGSILSVCLTGYLMGLWNPHLGPLAMVVVGLGSPLFFYSQVFWEHSMGTMLSLAALALLASSFRSRKWSITKLVFVALTAIAAVTLRAELLAWVVGLALAWGVSLWWGKSESRVALVPRKTKLLYSGAIIIGSGVVILAVASVFLLNRRYQSEAQYWLARWSTGEKVPLDKMGQALPALLINTSLADGARLSENWGWIGMLMLVVCAIAPWMRSYKAQAALLLPALGCLGFMTACCLFSNEPYRALHSFILTMPLLALAPGVLPDVFRNRQNVHLLVASTAIFGMLISIFFIIIARSLGEGGYLPGLEWGNRYLLSFYPLLSVLALAAVERYWKSSLPFFIRYTVLVMAVILGLLGIQAQARGIWMLNESEKMLSLVDAELEKRRPQPVVTDVWWLPGSLAGYFTTYPLYSVNSPDGLADWLVAVVNEGETSATVVSHTIPDISILQSQLVVSSPNIILQVINIERLSSLLFIELSMEQR